MHGNDTLLQSEEQDSLEYGLKAECHEISSFSPEMPEVETAGLIPLKYTTSMTTRKCTTAKQSINF